MTVQLERQLRRRTDAIHWLWGFIHGAARHPGPVRDCTEAGCTEARAALEEPATADMPADKPGRTHRNAGAWPELVQPGQIFKSTTTKNIWVKVVEVHGPFAVVDNVDSTGKPTGGRGIPLMMDGPRAINGYIRDLNAERGQ